MSNERSGGHLFVISAPSGAGKTTLCRAVIKQLAPTIRYSISHTTRPARGKEIDGVDYHFVSEDRFAQMIADGELAEWATIHLHRYGTAKTEIDRALANHIDLFLDIEGEGALQIKKLYPEAVLVFIVPPSLNHLRQRLEARHTESPQQIDLRLNNVENELKFSDHYDYIVVNDDLSQAIADLTAVVRAQRCRQENRIDAIRRLYTA